MHTSRNDFEMASEENVEKLKRGPKGYGEPEDRSLRKVELEVMIPKIMRERCKTDKCLEFKNAFDQCCLDNAMMMVVRCREENRRFKECQNKWFFDKNFFEECKEIYLEQRAEFRRTGVKKKLERKRNASPPAPSTVES